MTEESGFWSVSAVRYAMLIEQADVIQKIVFPALLRAIRPVGAILDYGGGPGLFIKLLPGDRDIGLYDPSKEAVALAKRSRLPQSQSRGHFWTSTSDIPQHYFSEVVMCFVLMSIPTTAGEDSALRNARKAITDGGQLSVVITHPCFREQRFSCFETDFYRGRPFDYRSLDVPFQVFLHGADADDELILPNFHRPLETTLNSICAAGFRIKEINELYDCSERGWFNKSAPPYLLVKAAATDL
jgi:hypothetical protein